MARIRIRSVKIDLWAHEDLSALPAETHILSAAILNYADDEGYFNANPKLIQAALFPLRELSSTVPVMLQELADVGYLRFFDGTDGKKYGVVCKFKDHQVISHPKDSKIKLLEPSSNPPVKLPSSSVLKGRERNGKELEGNGTVTREQTYEAVPENSELMVEQLVSAHPKNLKPKKSEFEAMQAIVRESTKFGGAQPAYEYLLARTNLYKQKTDDWPDKDQQYIVSAEVFFRDRCYEADEKMWVKGVDIEKAVAAAAGW